MADKGLVNLVESTSRLSQRWVHFKNDSAEVVPPFGVVDINGTHQLIEGLIALNGLKPTGGGGIYAINGPVNVAVGDYGICTLDFPTFVKVSGSPSVGDELGPENNQWHAKTNPDSAQFKYLGLTIDDRVYVSSVGGGGDCLVKVTSDDDCAVLEEQWDEHVKEEDPDNPKFEEEKDEPIATETIEVEGDKRMRSFIDISQIDFYMPDVEQALYHRANGGLAWIRMGLCRGPDVERELPP